MSETFEIMFDDLNEDAQKAYLEFENLASAEDGNLECFPLAILDKSEEVDDE